MPYAANIISPTRDRKAYRLKCRFKIYPHPLPSSLGIEKVRVAEMFVSDMRKQGWENLPAHGFRMYGPFPYVAPVTIHPVKAMTAREMLPLIRQGATIRDRGHDAAIRMPSLKASEWWEYEIAGVFSRPEILTEYADPHEEKKD